MQLVSFCREQDLKRFGHKAVFSHLIEDLKDLETNGITIAEGYIVKGTVCAITGDNLGSHCIGGFTPVNIFAGTVCWTEKLLEICHIHAAP